MGFSAVQRIVGFLIAASSLMMLPPVLVSAWYQDGTAEVFLACAGILLVAGLLIYFPVRNAKRDLRIRHGFLIVVCAWLAWVLVGALPFVLLTEPHLSYTDAVFESMSGLTTTGATIITNIDVLPRAVLYYRQQLQWLGGMGIIVLAVAILPMLRVGGMQLYRAETPGPMKDAKLTPRITETAKALWLIYFGITVTCVFAYWLAGMQLFDAVGHAFSTVAIGGFSTHNESLAFWNNPTIEVIAMVFMAIAGINFALHFSAWRRASAQPYFFDPELKVYAVLLLVFSVLVSFVLFFTNTYDSLVTSFRYGFFQVVSAMTTTGFTTAPFYQWTGFLPVLLILVAFIGGCAGSTAGGMKVIRVILLYKQSIREVRRLIHPHAVIPVKVGGQRTSDTVISAVWGFFFLYIASFAVMTVLLTATGLDAETAYSAVGACITNLGPALGDAGPNYANLNNPAKIILSIAMLLGRLEIYTLLVLLTPAFWRD
ncbi:MAG: TrkH family potassium uptake protein [Xanthomonadales bacterium]|jgi:trk system potassium uptake protein TrkH|nr:TrkH family potassium uptake protein [Xanthomonadales bacterium]